MLQSQLSGKPHGGGGHGGGHGGSNPLGQIIGGLTHSGGGGHGGHGGGGGGVGGKLAGQLASNLFSSGGGGGSKPTQPSNYHGGAQTAPHGGGGLAGSVMGGITHMFGGNSQGSSVRRRTLGRSRCHVGEGADVTGAGRTELRLFQRGPGRQLLGLGTPDVVPTALGRVLPPAHVASAVGGRGVVPRTPVKPAATRGCSAVRSTAARPAHTFVSAAARAAPGVRAGAAGAAAVRFAGATGLQRAPSAAIRRGPAVLPAAAAAGPGPGVPRPAGVRRRTRRFGAPRPTGRLPGVLGAQGLVNRGRSSQGAYRPEGGYHRRKKTSKEAEDELPWVGDRG